MHLPCKQLVQLLIEHSLRASSSHCGVLDHLLQCLPAQVVKRKPRIEREPQQVSLELVAIENDGAAAKM